MSIRSCLSSKYKAYVKSFQAIQTSIVKRKSELKCDGATFIHKSNVSQSVQNIKDRVFNSKVASSCGKTLNTFQVSLEQKLSPSITALMNTRQKMIKRRKSLQERVAIKSNPNNTGQNPNSTSEHEKLINSLIKIRDVVSRHRLSLLRMAVVGVHQSSDVSPQAEGIPEPPPIPIQEFIETTTETINHLNALGESTFASLGLGGMSPVGLVQTCFEYFHVTLGIPWWEAIMLGTIIIRVCLFPLVVIAQRNAAKMNNYLPQMQVLQMKMTEARQTGNMMEAARWSQELMIFMKEKQLNPLKNMIVPLAQMPVFISFFMALRHMSNVPVESLRNGGLWWFQDLTVPDQYFLLPLITSITLFATIEIGADSGKLSSQNLQTMKYVLRALPICMFPFIINFPGAILCYWVSSNFISLAQVGILRIPTVRNFFKIEPLVVHKAENLPIKLKGFTEGIKDSWTNIKITKELEDRRRVDDLQFQRAGKGPLVKTYKYDPTQQLNPNAVSAKKR